MRAASVHCMTFHAEFTTERGQAPTAPSPVAESDARAALMRDVIDSSLDRRLAAVLHPLACVEMLRRAFDGVRDDRHPTACHVRSVVAARLHLAWQAAAHPVHASLVARAAAGRVPLHISPAVLRSATRWSPLVRASIGEALAKNADPVARVLGVLWTACREQE